MISFDWKKNIEDSIKDGLIITATTTGIFYVLKAANVKPPKASVPGCYGYHETCWWNSGWCPCQRLCSLQKMDQRVIQQQNFIALSRAIKLYDAIGQRCASITF